TDITGFGLAGHLLEMLRASGVAAEIDLSAVALLPGTAALLAQGIESTLAPANRAAEAEIERDASCAQLAAYAALFDPQTSGGLLVSFRPAEVEGYLSRLSECSSPPAAVIGQVIEHSAETPRLRIK
ncbi:MAG TPA: AIR synthase-related protein, partial [Pirellulales bacterium]|nr:AIR synthase-related protein [Pirellulales bacterium]